MGSGAICIIGDSKLRLHNIRSEATGYTTWGCYWKKDEVKKTDSFKGVNLESNESIKMQTRITAYWPDGSVKWTAHTANASGLGKEIEVVKSDSEEKLDGLKIEETEEKITISDKEQSILIDKNKETLFEKVVLNNKTIFEKATPVLQLEHPVEVNGDAGKVVTKYRGKIRSVTLEERGPLQVIVKYEGIHVSKNKEEKFPFVIRMTVGKGVSEIKFTHTFLYDGDENKDFLKGLGIEFKTKVSGPMYNRHVKFMNEHGMYHEASVGLLSWRPRVPAGIYDRQMAGEKLELIGTDLETVNKVLKDTPYWDTFDLCQDSATHYLIKKKLAGDDLCYIEAQHGVRTNGGASFGSEEGSVIMSIRDFWEKYPSGYEIKNMSAEVVTATMWFYSPQTGSYDFRHYARRGYNQVCYEGYDYKGADPVGIACTNECSLVYTEKMIPEDDTIVAFCNNVNKPALYVGTPEFYHSMGAFGYWSLPSKNTKMEEWLEQQLERAFDFYSKEVEQRGWYGMFNYGDFMHSYDSVRHQWKYDTGGYAWDNTELVPTLWLWLYFLRTGREDVFTLAEKLCRHASEVDVYHFGKYKGLGSRHNVRHWGCPCKEARIAMAGHHRYLYYFTGDRRLEDIFDELKDNEMSFLNKDPLGDFFKKEDMVYPSHARSGPDWSSLTSNWMMQWERKNDTAYRDKINVGLSDIKAAPLKLSSGPDFEFDPKTVHLRYIGERTTGGVHLQICMGAPQIWMELADLLEDEEFKKMIADYGRLYYLPHDMQMEETKGIIGKREFSLPFFSAGMGAYGAKYLKDDWLAKRTWEILLGALLHDYNSDGFISVLTPKEGNRAELVEIPWITTNFTAQWCLNVIVVLEFIKSALPETIEDALKLVENIDSFYFRKA